MVKNNRYSAPETEFLEVRFEGNIMSFDSDNMEILTEEEEEELS